MELLSIRMENVKKVVEGMKSSEGEGNGLQLIASQSKDDEAYHQRRLMDMDNGRRNQGIGERSREKGRKKGEEGSEEDRWIWIWIYET